MILGAVIWFAGAELEMRFAHFGDIAASVAVIAMALGSRSARFMNFAWAGMAVRMFVARASP